MIANFFQSLEAHGVDYLLISGQATVLYGASTFSEDIDLWVAPSERNRRAFLASLAAQKARYYKATPAFDLSNLRRGHGFHFTVPNEPEFFLDVMGRPPRVRSFSHAARRGRKVATAWGTLPVVAIKDLVEIKKTQRVSDYPVVSQLAKRYLEQTASPSRADYEWAVANTFTLADFEDLVRTHPEAGRISRAAPPLARCAADIARRGEIAAKNAASAETWLLRKMADCQQKDRGYWRQILRELRQMNRDGGLMPLGARVQPLPA